MGEQLYSQRSEALPSHALVCTRPEQEFRYAEEVFVALPGIEERADELNLPLTGDKWGERWPPPLQPTRSAPCSPPAQPTHCQCPPLRTDAGSNEDHAPTHCFTRRHISHSRSSLHSTQSVPQPHHASPPLHPRLHPSLNPRINPTSRVPCATALPSPKRVVACTLTTVNAQRQQPLLSGLASCLLLPRGISSWPAVPHSVPQLSRSSVAIQALVRCRGVGVTG